MARLTALLLLCVTCPALAGGTHSGGASGTTRVDQFSAVQCGKDVPKALIGKLVRNDRVVVIEAAHRDIGLKNTGGSFAGNGLFLVSWTLCGAEYQLLEDRHRVRDAIRFTSHSRRHPGYFGTCRVNGKKLRDDVLAVLDNPEPHAPGEPLPPANAVPLKAVAAWRVDTVRARLIKLPTAGLTCPRLGIFTVDGGM